MPIETRREFTRHALQSLTALALIEGLGAHRLFGADVQPIVDEWFKELDSISRDVHDQRMKDVEFQKALEGLYGRVDLPALLKTLDFDRMAAGVNFPAHGARSLPVDFKNVSGLPTEPGLRPADLRDEQGEVGHPPRPRQHGHRLPDPEGDLARPPLRPRRGPQGPLHRPPDDRPHLHPRPVLDHLRPQGQRPLVHGRERSRLHLQHPRQRHRPRQPQDVRAGSTWTRWARSSPAGWSRPRRSATARRTRCTG